MHLHYLLHNFKLPFLGLGAALVLVLLLGHAQPARALESGGKGGAPIQPATPYTATWTVVPNGSTPPSNLEDVAALNAGDAWAVGSSIIHWDGASWQPVATSAGVAPQAVAAAAADDVWVVGTSATGTGTAHWDGQTWQTVPSPNGSLSSNMLNDVTIVSPTDVWAVGSSRDPIYIFSEVLVLHWDGQTWTQVAIPRTNMDIQALTAVTAFGPNNVWAVGTTCTYTSVHNCSSQRTLILHWDGSTWTVAPENVGAAYLADVAGSGPNDIWAVGYAFVQVVSGLAEQPVMMHWNGTAWSQVTVPSADPDSSYLRAVTVLTATDAWAGGYSGGTTTNPTHQTQLMHWDGTNWSLVTSPNVGSSDINGLAAAPTGDVWAVGVANWGTGNQQMLTLHYTPPVEFADVPTSSPFYGPITRLALQGIVGGYACGSGGEPCIANLPYYRPGTPVSRGQAAKIVAGAAGATSTPTGQTFADVSPTSTFYTWVEPLAAAGVVSGYVCGTRPDEPCDDQQRPYYRPGAGVTRGQLSKLVALAAHYSDPPTGQTFEDVPPGSTFYTWVQQVSSRGIISGYACGGAGEPCVGPTNRPYFRPANGATRGQTAKIISGVFLPALR
jgi:hypothetical protein